jgi:CheY-like chemotaxis protein
VEASSAGLEKGAEFTIRLPIETLKETKVQNASAEPCLNDIKYRVLVIEDNHDAAKSAQMLLHLEGHDVRVASTALTGLESARTFQPQVILCDIGLPEIDGYQVVRTIREDADLSSTYVIALTGYGRQKDQQQALDAGFDLHLTKPIDYAGLRRALALANSKYDERVSP